MFSLVELIVCFLLFEIDFIFDTEFFNDSWMLRLDVQFVKVDVIEELFVGAAEIKSLSLLACLIFVGEVEVLGFPWTFGVSLILETLVKSALLLMHFELTEPNRLCSNEFRAFSLIGDEDKKLFLGLLVGFWDFFSKSASLMDSTLIGILKPFSFGNFLSDWFSTIKATSK